MNNVPVWNSPTVNLQPILVRCIWYCLEQLKKKFSKNLVQKLKYCFGKYSLKAKEEYRDKKDMRQQKVKPWTLIQQININNTKYEWIKQSSQMAESVRRDKKT